VEIFTAQGAPPPFFFSLFVAGPELGEEEQGKIIHISEK
jgi:hypothetical protein